MSALEPLPLDAWEPTRATLHRYAQIVGKIQLELTPLVNHWWNVTLLPTARGLSTRAMPYGERTFDLAFDFVDHALVVRTSDGAVRGVPLGGQPVAEMYRDLLGLLDGLGLRVAIDDRPVEIPTDAIPFHEDRMHAAYDRAYVERFWRIIQRSAVVLEEFRARFIGKSSLVQFFWGSFDLAVTRFSGRRAPADPNLDAINREAYSHEVSSCGFWPGDARFPEPAYYAYAAPNPRGYGNASVRPGEAFWHEALANFLLPYETVRGARDPRGMLLEFCQSTYDAAAELARWNREALERDPPPRRETTMPQPPAHAH